MARRIEVLREIWRITERRGNSVYTTKYVETKWVPMEEAEGGRPNNDPNLMWVTVSDPTVSTIRSVTVPDVNWPYRKDYERGD